MEKVQQTIKKFFGEYVEVVKDPYPDYVVAKGAAVLAGIKSGELNIPGLSFDSVLATNQQEMFARNRGGD